MTSLFLDGAFVAKWPTWGRPRYPRAIMRIGLSWAAAVGLAAAIVGCGGKVVVDSGNAGGAGGSGSTTSTTGTTMSTGTGVDCGAVDCTGGPDGSCACDGVCNAQKLTVQCQPIQGGASCSCIENGIKIAVCVQPGSASCGLLDECCAAQFFGPTGGD